jgi:hypothetical protein
MLPFRIRNFRLNQAERADAEWLRRRMAEECAQFGGEVVLLPGNILSLGRGAGGAHRDAGIGGR